MALELKLAITGKDNLRNVCELQENLEKFQKMSDYIMWRSMQ